METQVSISVLATILGITVSVFSAIIALAVAYLKLFIENANNKVLAAIRLEVKQEYINREHIQNIEYRILQCENKLNIRHKESLRGND